MLRGELEDLNVLDSYVAYRNADGTTISHGHFVFR